MGFTFRIALTFTISCFRKSLLPAVKQDGSSRHKCLLDLCGYRPQKSSHHLWWWYLTAILAAQAFPQPVTMLEKAMGEIRSIRTLTCTVVRKQVYRGITKTAQCVFSYDRQKGKFAYAYASPYDYSFWVSDSAVCGMNRNSRRGYVVKVSEDTCRYRSFLESIHVCGPLFKFGKMDTLRVSLKASIDDFLYFEHPMDVGKEILKVDRNKNIVTLIETFDSSGAVRQQTILEYDTTKGKSASFPQKIVIRENSTGIVETDTLLFKKLEINKKIKESVFTPPEFTDIMTGK